MYNKKSFQKELFNRLQETAQVNNDLPVYYIKSDDTSIYIYDSTDSKCENLRYTDSLLNFMSKNAFKFINLDLNAQTPNDLFQDTMDLHKKVKISFRYNNGTVIQKKSTLIVISEKGLNYLLRIVKESDKYLILMGSMVIYSVRVITGRPKFVLKLSSKSRDLKIWLETKTEDTNAPMIVPLIVFNASEGCYLSSYISSYIFQLDNWSYNIQRANSLIYCIDNKIYNFEVIDRYLSYCKNSNITDFMLNDFKILHEQYPNIITRGTLAKLIKLAFLNKD